MVTKMRGREVAAVMAVAAAATAAWSVGLTSGAAAGQSALSGAVITVTAGEPSELVLKVSKSSLPIS